MEIGKSAAYEADGRLGSVPLICAADMGTIGEQARFMTDYIHNSLCAQAIKSHHVALPRCADLAGRWLFLAIWSHLRHFSHYLAQRSKAIRWLLVALRTLSIFFVDTLLSIARFSTRLTRSLMRHSIT